MTDKENTEIPRGLRRYAITGFIVYYIYSAFLMAWPFPDPNNLTQRLLGPSSYVVDFLGIWHRLRLFAPQPPGFTGTIKYQLVYQDGTFSYWNYPREVLGIGDPPGSYNRYLFTYIAWGADRKADVLWPELARYIASQNSSSEHPLASVRIVERCVRIPTPDLGIGKPLPPPNQEFELVNYDVNTGSSTVGNIIAVW